jgi:hypothetical protein
MPITDFLVLAATCLLALHPFSVGNHTSPQVLQPAIRQVDAPADRADSILEAVGSGLPANLLALFKRRFPNPKAKSLPHPGENDLRWVQGVETKSLIP